MTGLEREARRWAREIVALEYATVDEIWNRRRVRYESVAEDYDAETIREIARRMPNLLVRQGGVALDELCAEYGFASTCDLIDLFVNYTSKRIRLAELEEQYVHNEHLADMPF